MLLVKNATQEIVRIALALTILLISEKNAMKTCSFSRLGHEEDKKFFCDGIELQVDVGQNNNDLFHEKLLFSQKPVSRGPHLH